MERNGEEQGMVVFSVNQLQPRYNSILELIFLWKDYPTRAVWSEKVVQRAWSWPCITQDWEMFNHSFGFSGQDSKKNSHLGSLIVERT